MARFIRVCAALAGILAIVAVLALMRTPAPLSEVAVQPSQPKVVQTYTYSVVREYPHDPEASTQGLIYYDGFLYESTGPTPISSLRKVRLETGEVIQMRTLHQWYFGEGLTEWDGKLIQLTPIRKQLNLTDIHDVSSFIDLFRWQIDRNKGFTYDLASLEPQTEFSYRREAWGLTRDARRLIMSDGSSRIRFFDPAAFAELGRIEVTDGLERVDSLNELEFVKGRIYANVFHQDRIAIIDPESAEVVGWIDLSGLKSRMAALPDDKTAMLNGIAYDAAGDRLFVTGKLWPRLFEIRLVPRGGG